LNKLVELLLSAADDNDLDAVVYHLGSQGIADSRGRTKDEDLVVVELSRHDECGCVGGICRSVCYYVLYLRRKEESKNKWNEMKLLLHGQSTSMVVMTSHRVP